VINVNLRGVWLCQRAQITQMLKQEADQPTRTGAPPQRGAIANISSILGLLSSATNGSYAASKSGVLGLVRTDAAAYGPHGIRLNAVCPGTIYTPMLAKSMEQGAGYAKLLERTPIPRWGRPEEVAQVCVFLVGGRASFVTGEEVLVDGGLFHVM
ncbi:hypothetical protein LTS18_000787, partial [Coniosporium uncinatum]